MPIPNPIARQCARRRRPGKEFRESGGLFNIAIGAAVRLWRFGLTDAERRIPDPEALARAISLADCGRIRLDETGVTVPSGMEIDLGGIAKGYIADQLGNFLRKRGVKSALINLGGNILTIGGKPDGSDWSIGLQLPVLDRKRREEFWGVLPSRDNAVVTSGSYERGFLLNGIWYHHILDPRSGMPSGNGVLSVTVCAPTAFLADALSTPLFLLGPEKGVTLAEKYRVFAVYYMEDQRVLCCNGAGFSDDGVVFFPARDNKREVKTY